MIFTKKIKSSFDIYGNDINEVCKTKFIGVLIDNKLNWKDHISYVASKISRGLGMIIKARNYLNKDGLVNWYYSFIYTATTFLGWVGLWSFLWWAPSAMRKDHHGVSSGWSSVWHRSNTGLSSTQYEQIPITLGVWPFWLTPFFFGQWHFGGLMVKLYFLCWNYSLSSGWHMIAA